MTSPPARPEPDASTAAQAPVQKPRDPTFDILKGISILEVMVHHLLSTVMRKYVEDYSPAWWALATASRILHFAVPTFLLVSAVLLARSVASRPVADWRRFYARRVQRTLWPYLVWSVGYILFRLYVLRAGSDIVLTPLAVPFFGAVHVPDLLTPSRLWINFFWGKAYFHIYFMVVLLQFSVLFPFLLAFVRRLSVGFVGIVVVSAAVQYGAFLAQRHGFRVPYPGSTVFWYCMPILVGLWIGLNWREWEDTWKRWRFWIATGTVSGLAVYLPLALMHYAKMPYSSMMYNGGIAVYCLGIALVLLAFSQRLAATPRLWGFLQRIGDRSIALFLIHPMVLYLLGGPKITAVLTATRVPGIALAVVMFAVTWGLSQASRRLRLDGVLFGR